MSLNIWRCRIYTSNADTSSSNYSSNGEVSETTISALDGARNWDFYCTRTGWHLNNAGELGTDISGRPFAVRRGWVDSWTITSVPYSYRDGDFDYGNIATELPYIFSRKNVWVRFDGPDKTGFQISDSKLVKVLPSDFSEADNDAKGTRTFTLTLRRKFRP